MLTHISHGKPRRPVKSALLLIKMPQLNNNHRFNGAKISPQYDNPYLPQYHLPELRGGVGRVNKVHEERSFIELDQSSLFELRPGKTPIR
jgi:hypothetical protein